MSVPEAEFAQIITPTTAKGFGGGGLLQLDWFNTNNQSTINFLKLNYEDYISNPDTSHDYYVSSAVVNATKFIYGATLAMPVRWGSDGFKFSFLTKLREVLLGENIEFEYQHGSDYYTQITPCTHYDDFLRMTLEKQGDQWYFYDIEGGKTNVTANIPEFKLTTPDTEYDGMNGDVIEANFELAIDDTVVTLYCMGVELHTYEAGVSIHTAGAAVGITITPNGYLPDEDPNPEENYGSLNYGVSDLYVKMCVGDVIEPANPPPPPPVEPPPPSPSPSEPSPTDPDPFDKDAKYILLTTNKDTVNDGFVLFFEYFNFPPSTRVDIECIVDEVLLTRAEGIVNNLGGVVLPVILAGTDTKYVTNVYGVDWGNNVTSNTITISQNMVGNIDLPIIPYSDYPTFDVNMSGELPDNIKTTVTLSPDLLNLVPCAVNTGTNIDATDSYFNNSKSLRKDHPEDLSWVNHYDRARWYSGPNATRYYLHKYSDTNGWELKAISGISYLNTDTMYDENYVDDNKLFYITVTNRTRANLNNDDKTIISAKNGDEFLLEFFFTNFEFGGHYYIDMSPVGGLTKRPMRMNFDTDYSAKFTVNSNYFVTGENRFSFEIYTVDVYTDEVTVLSKSNAITITLI